MVVGIIAEYNPFHNGHKYQIEQIRNKVKNAAIVAVMSGNFTQRGEAAILDKFTRAELAVNGGCDLVLELPFVYAVRSAQDFARGGINILKSLGIVETLAFGAEINDIESLKTAASIVDSDKFNNLLRRKLDSGLSYAKAMGQILSETTDISQKILKMPNIILAIEYLRALQLTSMQPLLIPRIAVSHNDINLYPGISSASAIRKSIYLESPEWNIISTNIDGKTLNTLKNVELPSIERLFLPLITKIICSDTSTLKSIYGMNEGLENKFIYAAHSSKSLQEFVNCIVSQRYTRSRIQRLILYFIMELLKEDIDKFNNINYARILAFNQRGRELLKKIKKNTNIPIITKLTQHISNQAIYNQNYILNTYQKMLYFDIVSTDIFSILFKNAKLGLDFTTSPLYLH